MWLIPTPAVLARPPEGALACAHATGPGPGCGVGGAAQAAQLGRRPGRFRPRLRSAWSWPLRLWLALWLLLWGPPPPSQAWDSGQARQAAQRLGPAAVASLNQMQAMMAEARPHDEAHRLVVVNRWFNNQVMFRPDTEIWGQEDYWASPLQTLSVGRGDCEDFVIAKYAALLALGLPVDKLRLVYVRARLPDQVQPLAHMVLAYYATPGAEPLILDNLRPEVLPASQRPDLAPVFSFNSAGLWQGVGGASAGDPMARLSRWRDVWQRTRQEGFP